jgi:hypothetical protein
MRKVLARIGEAARRAPRRLTAAAEYWADNAPAESTVVKKDRAVESREIETERRPRPADPDEGR